MEVDTKEIIKLVNRLIIEYFEPKVEKCVNLYAEQQFESIVRRELRELMAEAQSAWTSELATLLLRSLNARAQKESLQQ